MRDAAIYLKIKYDFMTAENNYCKIKNNTSPFAYRNTHVHIEITMI